MARLFLSYAREDFESARTLAAALKRAGHTVWWDRHIKGGEQYAPEIEAALAKSDVIVVLWSQSSVGSPWVRDEAAEARDSARLVPVTLDRTAPPMGFRQYQAVDMSAWKGRGRPAHFSELLEAIEGVAGTPQAGHVEIDRAQVSRLRRVAALRFAKPAKFAAIGLIALVMLAVGTWLYLGRSDGGDSQAAISMAVLPFDSLPADAANAPFAEGVSEEILGELARNPRLKLVGRTSAATFRNSTADPRTIGDKLGVAYLLNGTVRRDGSQVRVAVELVRAKDGMQLWRDSYTGSLDDIFEMQDRIAQGVEGQLRATFVGKAGVTASTLATSGEAYGYYLTARSLIRDREAAKLETAIELLRKALKIDPNYAPAWASLAMAVHFQGNSQPDTDPAYAKTVRLSIAYANRALMLAPQLAEAHMAKDIALSGMIGSPYADESMREAQIAARLDPNNAEIWNALAQGYAWQGDYVAELDAWRRAVQIDPLWPRAFYYASESAWQMGYEDEAWRYVRRIQGGDDRFQAHMVSADMAFRHGDLSGQLKEGLAAKAMAPSGRRYFADLEISTALRAAGYMDQARSFGGNEVDDTMWKLWHGEPPSSAEITRLFRDPILGWYNPYLVPLLLKALLNKGRSNEVVALYRQRFGSIDRLQPYPRSHWEYVENGTAIAIALREVGQEDEANRLLAVLRKSVDERLSKGRVPRPYYFLAAQVAAAQRDVASALSLLEKFAQSNRWWYFQHGTFGDIADEPAFRSLKGHPRFEAIAARQRAWQAKERREIAPMLDQLGAP